MTILTLPRFSYPFPTNVNTNSAINSAVNFALTASGHKAAMVFRCGEDEAGTLDKIIFAVNTVTGSCTLDIRVETVDDTTGFPTGTLAWANASASQASLVNNTSYEVTLTASGTLVAGTRYAIVLAYNAGTTINVTGMHNMFGRHFPYGVLNNTGAYVVNVVKPVAALKVGGSYRDVQSFCPSHFNGITTFNTGSTPDERGNKFTLPTTVRAKGIHVQIQVGATTRDFDLVLYDAASSVIETISCDANDMLGTGGGQAYYPFSVKQTLTAGLVYRVILKPTTTGDLTWCVWDALSTAHMLAMPGRGDWVATSRVDAGAWTDVTTGLYPIWLELDGIEVAGPVVGGKLVT